MGINICFLYQHVISNVISTFQTSKTFNLCISDCVWLTPSFIILAAAYLCTTCTEILLCKWSCGFSMFSWFQRGLGQFWNGRGLFLQNTRYAEQIYCSLTRDNVSQNFYLSSCKIISQLQFRKHFSRRFLGGDETNSFPVSGPEVG